MNKFYLIITFIGLTFFANAQTGKSNEGGFTPVAEQVKVLRFYPNPAVNVINFEFHKSVEANYTLQVYNFVGKKVYEQNNVSHKTIIPLTEFYRGVYIFQLRDKTGRVIESGKFQVNR